MFKKQQLWWNPNSATRKDMENEKDDIKMESHIKRNSPRDQYGWTEHKVSE